MSYSVSLHLNKSLILIHMTQYIDIATKLITGMVGILFFLRITGKAQMAQLTPLDTVSAFVIGALVGGVIYSPDPTDLRTPLAWAVGQLSTYSYAIVCAIPSFVDYSRGTASI